MPAMLEILAAINDKIEVFCDSEQMLRETQMTTRSSAEQLASEPVLNDAMSLDLVELVENAESDEYKFLRYLLRLDATSALNEHWFKTGFGLKLECLRGADVRVVFNFAKWVKLSKQSWLAVESMAAGGKPMLIPLDKHYINFLEKKQQQSGRKRKQQSGDESVHGADSSSSVSGNGIWTHVTVSSINRMKIGAAKEHLAACVKEINRLMPFEAVAANASDLVRQVGDLQKQLTAAATSKAALAVSLSRMRRTLAHTNQSRAHACKSDGDFISRNQKLIAFNEAKIVLDRYCNSEMKLKVIYGCLAKAGYFEDNRVGAIAATGMQVTLQLAKQVAGTSDVARQMHYQLLL